MSQELQLEDILQWDADQCAQNYHNALNKLTTCYKTCDSEERREKILELILQSFVPVCPLKELEESIFSHIASEIGSDFSERLVKIKDELIACAQDSHHLIVLQLQRCMTVLECLVATLEHVSSHNECIQLGHVHSLQQMVLAIIAATYSHCQESGSIYGDLMSALADQLSCLFKKAHTLQMLFISVLEQVQVESPCDQDVQDLCFILEELFHISEVAKMLDVKIMASLWKTISRLSCQYKDHIYQSLDVASMICALCNDIETNYQHNVSELAPRVDNNDQISSSGDEKAFQKGLKIVGFQMKVLLMLVKEYEGYLGDCLSQLYHMILNVHRWNPPCPNAPCLPSQLRQEADKQVTVALEPLIRSLITSRDFAVCVTNTNQDFDDSVKLPYLLTVTSIADFVPKLEDAEQKWWLSCNQDPLGKPTMSLYQAIFKAYSQCGVTMGLDVQVAGVMCNGKPHRKVSLWEHTCTHLCSLVASTPAKYFTQLENCLLENALSRDIFAALLAVDTWCFLARYGTSELCRDHCHLLCGLLSQMEVNTSPEFTHLVLLLQRLGRFLAPEHQEELLTAFPVESNLTLWCVMTLSSFSADVLPVIITKIINVCLKGLQTWLKETEKDLSSLHRLTQYLVCVDNVYRQHGESCLEVTLQAGVVSVVSELWQHLPLAITHPCPLYDRTRALLLNVTSYLLPDMNNTEILTVCQHALAMLKQDGCRDASHISVVHMLQAMANKTLTPSFEQQKILEMISELFTTVLATSNAIVKTEALHTFATFAEQTQHKTIIQQTMNRAPQLKDTVVQFINKVPVARQCEDGHTRPEEQEEAVQQYLGQSVEALYPAHCPADTQPEQQPYAKRLKRDEDSVAENSLTEDAIKKSLSQINVGLRDLCQIQDTGYHLNRYQNDLQSIQKTLNLLLDSNGY